MDKILSVTNDEKIEIEMFVERRNSLEEVKIILEDEELIKKQERDVTKNENDINVWWDKIFKKYDIQNTNQYYYFINFDDNYIYSK